MISLLKGLSQFSKEAYPQREALYQKLSDGQSPHTLFVTCSDSRIDPNLLTQTEPGELFVMRNAGNLVPVYGTSTGGEDAVIEYAVKALGVSNIVVCGHSKCGAMIALKDGLDPNQFPAVSSWLNHGKSTKDQVLAKEKSDLADYIDENTLVQIDNLKTHPSVKRALEAGKLTLSAWVYEFEKGKVHLYSKDQTRFFESSELGSINKESLQGFSL